MKLLERLELRRTILILQLVIEKILSLFKKYIPNKKIDEIVPDILPVEPEKKKRRRPLKKVVDTIDNILGEENDK